MVRKEIVSLLDDTDGTEASETVSFGLDNTRYEIDLSRKHAGELRGILALYIVKGRVITLDYNEKAGLAGDHAKVRKWAETHGHRVGRNGRIPASTLSAFITRNRAASPAPAPAEPRRAPGRARASGPAKLRFREPASPAPDRPAEPPSANGDRPAEPAEPAEPASTAEVRAWAHGKGIPIAIRGRVPQNIREQYNAEMSGPNND